MRGLLFVMCVLSILYESYGALYGYTDSQQLLLIDPQSGTSKVLCDLSKFHALSSAPRSANARSKTLHFYQINEKTGNITLIKVDPATCNVNFQAVKGLGPGQDEVRDIKYDNSNQKLYMVFPDPNCMQGSFDVLDANSAKVLSTLTTIVDPVGLDQTAALSEKAQKYYFIGLPFPPISTDYLLNSVDLASGNSDSVKLANNTLGLGDMWSTNFTLGVYDSSDGPKLFGAVSPDQSTTKNCYPSGFYAVDVKTGGVTCGFGPIDLKVYPVGEIDTTQNLYYQIFNDKKGNFFLYTYNIVKQQVISQVSCDFCKNLVVLSVVPNMGKWGLIS